MGSNYADTLANQAAQQNAGATNGETLQQQLQRQGFSNDEIQQRMQMNEEQQKLAAEQAKGQVAPGDPYGGSQTQSIRKRGSTEQQRVSMDTRNRGGTQGEQSSMGAAMQTPPATQAAPAAQTGNALWQATRQPTDLASVQTRLLQSFQK